MTLSLQTKAISNAYEIFSTNKTSPKTYSLQLQLHNFKCLSLPIHYNSQIIQIYLKHEPVPRRPATAIEPPAQGKDRALPRSPKLRQPPRRNRQIRGGIQTQPQRDEPQDDGGKQPTE